MSRGIVAVDLFAGAGGASTGLAYACRDSGLSYDLVAVNHWEVAIATHSRNHPEARHILSPIESVDPREAVPGGRVDLLIAAPECTHHSTARGGRPINDQSRASAWHILRWLELLRVEAVLIENVPEFRSWGPIGANGRPLKRRKGETFRAFLGAIESLGYHVDTRILNAADYGEATTRRRLFIQARRRRTGGPIVWPERTHGPKAGKNLLRRVDRWRPARDVIDWSIPGQSIFTRKRPLAKKTLARIAAGAEKFWGVDLEPFLLVLRNNQDAQSLDDPLPTITAGGIHAGIVEPFIVPFLGERKGQAPRVRSIEDPLQTVTASNPIGLAQPFVLQQQAGGVPRAVDQPLPTIAAKGAISVVEPYLVSYYGTKNLSPIDNPLPTVTAKDRFALVEPVPDGACLDIRFRMLQPHELAAAMGFPDDYEFTGTKTDQVRQIGNAISRRKMTALCRTVFESMGVTASSERRVG